MTDVNIPLLRKAVEWAEAEAAKPIELCEWEQAEWACPPEDRLGWKKLVQVSSRPEDVAVRLANKAPECGTCYCIAGYVSMIHTGRTVVGGQTETIAAEALGLDVFEADRLFAANNTIQDVREIAEEIAGESL